MTATDNTGKVRQNYNYDAFGKVTTINALGTKSKYQAMHGYVDPVTGFIYRGGGLYYNVNWGRTFSGNSIAGYPNAYIALGNALR